IAALCVCDRPASGAAVTLGPALAANAGPGVDDPDGGERVAVALGRVDAEGVHAPPEGLERRVDRKNARNPQGAVGVTYLLEVVSCVIGRAGRASRLLQDPARRSGIEPDPARALADHAVARIGQAVDGEGCVTTRPGVDTVWSRVNGGVRKCRETVSLNGAREGPGRHGRLVDAERIYRERRDGGVGAAVDPDDGRVLAGGRLADMDGVAVGCRGRDR